MKVILIFVILNFIFIIHSIKIRSRTGNWEKINLDSDDLDFNKALTFLNQQFQLGKFGETLNYTLIPISAYSQLVNGLNYKFLFATQNKEEKKLNFYTAIIYTGPFGSDPETTEPELTSNEKMNTTDVNNDVNVTNLKKAVSDYLKLSNLTPQNSTSIFYLLNVMENDLYIVYNTSIRDNGQTKFVTLIVYKNNSSYSVEKLITI